MDNLKELAKFLEDRRVEDATSVANACISWGVVEKDKWGTLMGCALELGSNMGEGFYRAWKYLVQKGDA